MSISGWVKWFRSTPWALRWFLLFIILRPVLAALYFLKDVSPLLSPLNIMGFLTPVLILASLAWNGKPRMRMSMLDIPFVLWSAIVALNCLSILMVEVSVVSLDLVFKLTTCVFIYIYLRHFLQAKQDLVGLLTTFLYASAFPFAMMLYEWFVNPLDSTVNVTRGFARASGLYADVTTYATYFVGAFFAAGFMFLLEDHKETSTRKAVRLGIVGTLSVMGLIHIHHTASWGVFLALVILLAYHGLKRRNPLGGVALLIVVVFVSVSLFDALQERFDAMLATEIEVMEGRTSEDRAFHGRGVQWARDLDYWRDRPALDRYLGVSIQSAALENRMLLGAVDSDYLRVTFSTGLIGLGLYLLFYFGLLLRSTVKQPGSSQFLIRGAVSIMLLYSITVVPSTYAGLLQLTFSALAFSVAASGAAIRTQEQGHRRHHLRHVSA